MKAFWGFVGKVFPTYAFDFDLPLPFKQAEEGVIFTGFSARMSERIRFTFASSAAAVNIATDEGTLMLFMRA